MAKHKVDIFIPCFIDQMFPETAFNMVKILESLDCEVFYNPDQTCCGQPAYNAGYFEDAREVASKLLNEFNKPERFIVTPSGSCGGMLKNGFTTLFKQTPNLHQCRVMQKNVFEFTQFLTEVLKVEHIPHSKLGGLAVYHDACSALRELKIKEGPRKLLSKVEGLELIEAIDCESCCGFGGTFSVKFEPISVAMAEQKIESALALNASYIISTDTSCLMHMDGYIQKKKLPIQAMHIVDVLANGW